MTDITLKCACGTVKGTAYDVSPENGLRVVCYCDDCQAFANELGRGTDTLDEFGGTDIYQMAPGRVTFSEGNDQLRCLRLTKKGTTRWYTACCNTPIGNTASSSVPFVGMIHTIMDDEGIRDQTLGPVRSYVQGNHAIGDLPPEKYNKGFPIGITLTIIWKILGWKISGKGSPDPFYGEDGRPVCKPKIVNEAS